MMAAPTDGTVRWDREKGASVADVVVVGGGPDRVGLGDPAGATGARGGGARPGGPPPDDPEAAWESWERRSVAQFRLVHYLQPGGRALMEEHLPAVFSELEAAGALRFNPAAAAARCLPDGAVNDLDLSRFETLTTCRRPLIDFAFGSRGPEDARYRHPLRLPGHGPSHRYPGYPGRGPRRRGAHPVWRDDRRPGSHRRGRAALAALIHDRSGRRAPPSGARLRSRFRVQHPVLPRFGAARAARRPAVRHRFDLGSDHPGRQWMVVGDPLSLAQRPADAQGPRSQNLRAGPSGAPQPRPLGRWRAAGRHRVDGRHRQHHSASSSSTARLAPPGSCPLATRGASPIRPSGGASPWG